MLSVEASGNFGQSAVLREGLRRACFRFWALQSFKRIPLEGNIGNLGPIWSLEWGLKKGRSRESVA